MTIRGDGMRYGNQVPTFEYVTEYAYTDGPAAVELFESYGVRFIPAQRYEMDLYMAKNALGECAALSISASRARQNGKSFSARYYSLYCAFVDGKSVLYSAHHGVTTRKMFKFMCDFVSEHKDFSDKLKDIYKAQGSEGIYLIDGSCIEFSTRTNSNARGGTYDVIVADEAQELTDEQRDALKPTSIASDSGDPQMILIGTPPNHKCPGTVFRDLHDRAHDGTLGDAWWYEWAATEIGNTHDVDRWYEYCPMMGYRIKERSMKDAADTTPPDSFAREYLGWWGESLGIKTVITKAEWSACETKNPPENGLMGVGVKFSIDDSRVALAVCLKPENERPYVEVVKSKSTSNGSRWVAEWLAKRVGDVALAIIDGKRGEAVMRNLDDENYPKRAAIMAAPTDMAKANAMLLDAVQSGEITHYGQPALEAAATKCAKRTIGKDGFGFEDTDQGDSTLIEACALAYRAAMTTKRNPKRKLRVG